MNGKTMVPLIDLVFLTLGSILAAMTQMERVEAIPVAVAQVAGSGQAVQRGEFDVVTVTARGVTVGVSLGTPWAWSISPAARSLSGTAKRAS